jgi:hypothetical protein
MFSIPLDSFVSEVPKIAINFPVFFGDGSMDSLFLLNLKDFFADPYMQELNTMTQEKYADISEVENTLSLAMQHYKYHFPMAEEYVFYSYISGLNLQLPVKVMDNNIVIGLDLYLGKNDIYSKSGFPKYKSKWLIKNSIAPDVMSELALGLLPPPDLSAKLLHQFIQQGKRLYFVQAMMPDIADTVLMKYTQKQINWCYKKESLLWSLMVENQFLFSSDVQIQKKFMEDGPFTSVLSSTAPARLGHFIGWRIISKYMANNDVTLAELLMETDDQKILKKSKYKPRR